MKPKEIIIDGTVSVTQKEQEITWDIIFDLYLKDQEPINISAVFKLAIIAKFLNAGRTTEDPCILFINEKGEIGPGSDSDTKGNIQFVDSFAARKAVEILGEKIVRSALEFGNL